VSTALARCLTHTTRTLTAPHFALRCSYNAENGVPSCANGWLLNEVLRERWGRPDAVVVTDSGALLNLKVTEVQRTGPPSTH
jgi:hypothetical protein